MFNEEKSPHMSKLTQLRSSSQRGAAQGARAAAQKPKHVAVNGGLQPMTDTVKSTFYTANSRLKRNIGLGVAFGGRPLREPPSYLISRMEQGAIRRSPVINPPVTQITSTAQVAQVAVRRAKQETAPSRSINWRLTRNSGQGFAFAGTGLRGPPSHLTTRKGQGTARSTPVTNPLLSQLSTSTVMTAGNPSGYDHSAVQVQQNAGPSTRAMYGNPSTTTTLVNHSLPDLLRNLKIQPLRRPRQRRKSQLKQSVRRRSASI